jgi:hypothetical protein
MKKHALAFGILEGISGILFLTGLSEISLKNECPNYSEHLYYLCLYALIPVFLILTVITSQLEEKV